jgi:hypothetical protein
LEEEVEYQEEKVKMNEDQEVGKKEKRIPRREGGGERERMPKGGGE